MPRIDRSLTAAALPAKDTIAVSRGVLFNSSAVDRQQDQEQRDRAWRAYDNIGEIHFIANGLIGSAIETLAWYGAVEDTATTYTAAPPVEDAGFSVRDATLIRTLIEGIRPPWGQQQDFMRALAINLFVVGQGYHLTEPNGSIDNWTHQFIPKSHILNEEKALNGKPVITYRDPITGKEQKVGESGRNLTRIWHPHPNNPSKADSAIFSILTLLDELEWIQRLMASSLRKRVMTSGVFIMPNSMLGPDYNPTDPTSVAGAVNSVEEEIIRQLNATIADDSDSPALPLLLWAPFEHVKDGFKHIDFGEQLSEIAISERNQVIRRIANSLDVPSEFVLGIGEVNHWSAWLIRDLLWQQHVQPMATLMANAITTSFLRPALQAAKKRNMFDGEPNEVKLWFRAHSLQTHPDLFDYLVKAHDLGIIGNKPILQALGIPEDVAITKEEFEQWRRLKEAQVGLRGGNGTQEPAQEGEVGPDGTVVEPAPSRERTGDRRRPVSRPADRSRSGQDGPSQR